MKFRRMISLLLAMVMIVGMIPAAWAAPASVEAVRDNQIGGERSQLFSHDWKFKLTTEDASGVDFDDSQWRELDVPHDWKIEKEEAWKHYYDTETGWYRKSFYLSEEDRGNNIALRFDGIQKNATVYVNGEQVVYYRSGYGTFQVDITDFVKFGNEENVVAVQVAFKHQDSWWYTGAGILRDVWLTTTGPVHVNYNGTYIYTDGVSNATVETEIANTSAEDKTVTVKQTVLDKATGEAVAETSMSDVAAQADAVTTICQELTVENAKLWGIDSPNLYIMKTEILAGEQVLDTYTTTFGFRTIEMDANEGFSLNGEYMKLHGVCMHADLGALGGAMSYAGMKARLIKLKEMGVNAIRTAHNICDPIWVELCDELGLFLYNEGLVSWNGNSYCMVEATDYEYVSVSPKLSDEPTWGEIDMRNFTRRDRNHPCVILWGIGNEVTDTTYDNSVELVQGIIPWVKTEDPQGNGLVTQGLNTVTNANTLRVAEQLDVVGYNYSMARFGTHHTNYPDHIIFGSETTSATSSRGIYHTPADERTYQHADMQVSSYDNCWVNWGNNAEDAWKYERDKKYVMGQFIWTGYDYIGEPTPYSKSDVKNSYFGIIDTAGLEKDSFYFWQSVWTEEPMVHLLPYWDSSMGDVITVFAYSNAHSVELFVNGESQGKQTIDLTTADELHYSWDVPYVDGEVIAKAYDASGAVVATDRIATFGEPAEVHLEADRQEMTADGRDLIYVTASILDENGEFVATARSEVKFTVSGAGELVGVDNGDSTDVDEYYATERNAFSGKVVAIIRSDGTEGSITVTAESQGLTTGTIGLMARHENPVTEITLRGIDGKDTITEPGGTLKMVAAVNSDADFEKVAYTVTDEKGDPTDCASIDSTGVLTAWKNGTVVVQAAALDGSGMTAEQTVTISGQNEAVTAQTITVTASADAITEKSGRIRFTAEVAPAGAEQAVRWTLVSGEGLLRQDGELVALYDGAVTVRAEALDGSGVTAEKTIEVSGQSNAVIPANKLLVQTQDGSDPILNADKPYVLVEAVLLPEGSVSDVEWNVTKADGSTVDETAIIDNVDANGVATVVAQGDGEFYVTASAKNESRFPQVFGMLKFTAEDLGVSTRDPYQFIEAVTCDETSARVESTSAGEQCLGGIGKNAYCLFRNLDFGVFGSKTFLLSGAADKNVSTLEIRKDSPDGEILTTIEFEATGEWHNFTAREYTLEGLTGVQDICIVYKSSYGMCIYGIQFTEKDHTGLETKDPYTETMVASADELSATTAAWTYLDFGEDGSKSVTLTGKSAQDAVVELRDGSPEGRLLGKMTFTASETEMTQSFRIPTLTGIKNLCFVFPEDFSFTSFVFRPAIRPAYQIIQAESYDSMNNTSGSLAEELHVDGEVSLQAMRTGLNDTLEYHSLDFGLNGSGKLLVYGKVDADAGSKQLMVLVDGEQLIPNTAMSREDGFVVYEFDAAGVTGVHDLQFSFIQGEDFLFDWFTFVEGHDILYRENIFLNKLTTAHNESSARGAAQNAVSDDSESWSAGCAGGDVWLLTDLGSVYDMDTMSISIQDKTEAYYKIELSEDNATWTTVCDFLETPGDLTQIPIGRAARYVRVTLSGKNGQTLYVTGITGNGTSRNIALDKPTTAGDWCTDKGVNVAQSPEKANNDILINIYGNGLAQKNMWCANGGANGQTGKWWQVDLGQAYDLAEITVITETDSAVYNFTLEGSLDGKIYQTIATVTDGGKVNRIETDTTARYLKINNLSTEDWHYAAVQNFIVYEKQKDTEQVTDIVMNRRTLTMERDSSQALEVYHLPGNLKAPALTWSSSEPNVVSVDEGVLNAKSVGTAVITARSPEGLEASCTVTVLRPAGEIGVTGVVLSQNEAALSIGGELILKAAVVPDNATNTNVIWTSSDPDVAAVDATGRIDAVSAGTAVITVTAVDGGYTAQCSVRVRTEMEDLMFLAEEAMETAKAAAAAAEEAKAKAEAAQAAAEEAAASAAEDKAAAQAAEEAAQLAQAQAEAAKAAAEAAKNAAEDAAEAAENSNLEAAQAAAEAAQAAKNSAESAAAAADSALTAAEAAGSAQAAQEAAEAAQAAAGEAAASAAEDKAAAQAAEEAAQLAQAQAEAAKAAAVAAKNAAEDAAEAAENSNLEAAQAAAEAAQAAKNSADSAAAAADSALTAAEAAGNAQAAQEAAEVAQAAAEEAAASAAEDKAAAQAASLAAETAKAQADAARKAAEAAQNAAEASADAAKDSNLQAAVQAAAAAEAAKGSADSAAAAAISAQVAAEAARAAQEAQERVEEAEKNVAADREAVEQAKKEAEEAARRTALSVAQYNALVELNEYLDVLREKANKEEKAALNDAAKEAREAINGAADEETVAQVLADGIEALDNALCAAKSFRDIDLDAWYHPAVDFVLNQGMMNGNTNGTFTPEESLTRAMLVQILYNIEGRPEVTTDKAFTDVAEGDWWYDAVLWAAENGIVLGNPDGTYAPEAPVTREQMVTILYRYAGSPAVEEAELTFDDAADVDDWAVTAVAWAVENGVVKGIGNNLFNPDGNSTRAETAQVMFNYFTK